MSSLRMRGTQFWQLCRPTRKHRGPAARLARLCISAISRSSEKIGDLPPGTAIRLILEPDNPDREDAVRAEADLFDRSTLRSGHLRRGHELVRNIAQGRVRCWLASRHRTLRADGWEAVLFVAVYDP